MGAESMGHALTLIHPLLKPTGCLIDLHPSGEPPPVTVRIKDEQFVMGWVREESDYVTYDQANEALETAVSQKLYRWAGQDSFAFLTYFDTLKDLQDHLANDWVGAYLDDMVAMQIEARLQIPTEDKEILLEEVIRIARLDPIKLFGD